MTLNNLFAEISERGWLVNNLAQLDDGTWRANLRTETHATQFSCADSPELALALCIDKLESTVPLISQTCEHTIEPAKNLASILANLRPKVIVDRRF
jgi:hypothetical protein